MKRIAIIHFQPLEYYPPIQNLLRVLKMSSAQFELTVLTIGARDIHFETFEIHSDRIHVRRLGSHGAKETPLKRYYNYLRFYVGCLFQLIVTRPSRILYFETLSSFPAYLYKRVFKRGVEIMIHYHEYTSPGEYRNGPVLNQCFHKWEKWLYPSSSWISHTNENRMEKFKTDISPVMVHNTHILPNFPPRGWYHAPKPDITLPLKIVYVGAVSMDTMYMKEFADWIAMQKGKVMWDIYSLNVAESAKAFFETVNPDLVMLKGAISYDELPSLLSKYDIGVILYNGHIPNYIYNAPNKLFEYLACGLSVLFPEIMTGSLPYCTSNAYPFVKACDFNNLSEMTPDAWIGNHSVADVSGFFCEDALESLVERLIK